MSDDLSRRAVLVLVVLAVAVSIISTSLVMNAIYTYVPADLSSQESNLQPSARVALSVPQQPMVGTVVLEVANPEDKSD